jgi:hypothetical protein
VGLLSFLTGGISEKYAAVQALANQISQKEAAHCYGFGFMLLCGYLDDPFDMANSRFNKTAYVEVLVSLHERLRGFDPWFSRNKGQFRMDLVRAILRDFSGQGVFTVANNLREFNFIAVAPQQLNKDREAELSDHVMLMLSEGP